MMAKKKEIRSFRSKTRIKARGVAPRLAILKMDLPPVRRPGGW